MKKLKSRKFWVCVAAMLGSIATSISGIVTDNKYIITLGVVCGVASAAIYAFCEAWVDGKAVRNDAWIESMMKAMEMLSQPKNIENNKNDEEENI